MRDFRVTIARDCVASNTEEDNETALSQLARIVHAEVIDSDEIALPNGAVAPDRSGVFYGAPIDGDLCEHRQRVHRSG